MACVAREGESALHRRSEATPSRAQHSAPELQVQAAPTQAKAREEGHAIPVPISTDGRQRRSKGTRLSPKHAPRGNVPLLPSAFDDVHAIRPVPGGKTS